MGRKFFGNQDAGQVIAHLSNLLRRGLKYNLEVDPLGVHFEIDEAVQRTARLTNQTQFSGELSGMSNRERRLFNLKRRRSRPKIRSVKRGRTVSLRGNLTY
jgi:hypothetical protein